MKSLLVLWVGALLALSASACGGTSATVATSSTTTTATASTTETPNETGSDADKDNDVGAPEDDKNNNDVLDSGSEASPSDRKKIVALVNGYYKIALAEDGAKACTMIYSTLAESVPEDYGSFAGPSYMRGTTCPAVLTLLFKHFHSLLAMQLPKLKVTRVRLTEHHGLAVLNFGKTLPERQISVSREGHVWRIATLLDSQLP